MVVCSKCKSVIEKDEVLINKKMNISTKQIDNIQFEGVEPEDYPDFCNAFIASCDIDGKEATEEQLDWINDNLLENYSDEIYQSLI